LANGDISWWARRGAIVHVLDIEQANIFQPREGRLDGFGKAAARNDDCRFAIGHDVAHLGRLQQRIDRNEDALGHADAENGPALLNAARQEDDDPLPALEASLGKMTRTLFDGLGQRCMIEAARAMHDGFISAICGAIEQVMEKIGRTAQCVPRRTKAMILPGVSRLAGSKSSSVSSIPNFSPRNIMSTRNPRESRAPHSMSGVSASQSASAGK